MKFFTENRRIAAAALAITVILSVAAGTLRSSAKLYTELETAYRDSGAAEDMAMLTESAYQVIAVYKAVIGDGMEADAEEQLGCIPDKGVPTADAGLSAGSAKQDTAVLYNTLLASGKMTEAQEFTAMKYYYDMLNAWTMLCENEEYLREAKRYNDAVSAVPLVFFGADSAAVFG